MLIKATTTTTILLLLLLHRLYYNANTMLLQLLLIIKLNFLIDVVTIIPEWVKTKHDYFAWNALESLKDAIIPTRQLGTSFLHSKK